MASTITAYDHLWKLLLTGAVDLDTDTLKLALVTSSYTFSSAHDEWADASTYEVATGSGYTTGGETLAGVSSANGYIDYSDVTWTSLTKTFRGAVCYKSGSGGGLTNPLLFYLLFDSTPADIVQSGSNFLVQWNATNRVFYRPA